MSIELKDKLYTSTQVAEILGVSLRTLYRYMEDGKIASMRTASGRHRFTKDQILDFLNAGDVISPVKKPSLVGSNVQAGSQTVNLAEGVVSSGLNVEAKDKFSDSQFSSNAQATSTVHNVEPTSTTQTSESVVTDRVSSVPSGNLANVSSAEIDTAQQADISEKTSVVETKPSSPPQKSEVEESEIPSIKAGVEALDLGVDMNIRYYKSEYSDLIELAKKTKDIAVSKDLEYAFTLYAGLSLHFLIKPFTILHFYANPEDMQVWKEELHLVPMPKKEDSNIGIVVNTDIVFVSTKDIGGYKVVEDKILLKDLSLYKEADLAKKFRSHLISAQS